VVLRAAKGHEQSCLIHQDCDVGEAAGRERVYPIRIAICCELAFVEAIGLGKSGEKQQCAHLEPGRRA
jgi:hypothetical protein